MMLLYGKKLKNYFNNMLSIVIPTLNEEKNLKRLLGLIAKENLPEYEIIIGDAGSKDKTVQVAESFGAKVVKGGLPAVGRNAGARAAKGDVILFLDADLVLSENFVAHALLEFQERRLDIASCNIYPQTNNIYLNKMTLNVFYNFPAQIFRKVFPMGAMAIMVTKKAYDQVGGFDEKIKLCEDHYFVGSVAKIGSFGILKTGKVYMPIRRFEKDGYLRTSLKYLRSVVYMNLFGPEKLNDIEYEFGHYDKKPKKKPIKRKKKDT